MTTRIVADIDTSDNEEWLKIALRTPEVLLFPAKKIELGWLADPARSPSMANEIFQFDDGFICKEVRDFIGIAPA